MDNYPWGNGEPNSENEHCVVLFNGAMHDILCTQKHEFICQTGPGTCAPKQTKSACINGWLAWNGGCYLFEVAPKTWSQASNVCEAKHKLSKLVEIDTKEENAFLVKVLTNMKKNVLTFDLIE